MKVKLFRKNKKIPLPGYQTAGSVAFDLSSSEDVIINPKTIALIPTGLIIRVPANLALVIAARSSTPLKKGLMLSNGIGIIDQDYCGSDDEIKIQTYNFTDKPVAIKKGERIAQGMFVNISKIEWEEIEEIGNETRGGFGSTG